MTQAKTISLSAADFQPTEMYFLLRDSIVVRPPRVAGAPVAYECRLYDILDVGVNKWIMGTVVHVHIDAEVYQGQRGAQRHRVDLLQTEATRPIARLGRALYTRLRDFETRLRKDGPNG